MTRRTQSVLANLILVLATAGVARAQALPSVATDRPDYSPGSTASISGAGFQSREAVRLQVLRIKPSDNDGQEHQPWEVRADANGRFKAMWPVTSHEAGATLRLSATGLVSRLSAHIVFTDAAISPASGGGAIPADTVGGSYTALSGPVLTETVIGDINAGTIVLTAPAGFVFDTNPPAPFITLSGDNNNKNINTLTNGATIALTVTTNALSFTVTSKSKGQNKNVLAYSNVRVRPTAATPLASGNITNTGTSIFPNSTVNFGTLTEVAGASTHLAVSGFPSPQIAGVPGSVTVNAEDQFGNPELTYAGTIHFTSSDPLAVLPPDYSFVSGDNGTHTFSAGVTLHTIGTQSITASNMAVASFTGTQSGITINPAPADHLAFVTQPGSATYGSLLAPQPVVVSQDAFGNSSTVGLGVSKIVSLTLSSGTGQLLGTKSLDIGTGAGNGTASFAGLAINAAGSGMQLTASAAGLSNAVSSLFAVNPATLSAHVTVNNKAYDATTSATIATRSLTGVLGGDNVTLVGGTAAFATKTAAIGKTVNVTGLTLAGASAPNYALASTTVSTTANITPAGLTVTGVGANNKVYDTTTVATLNGTASLLGVQGGDAVSLSGTGVAGFGDKTVGVGKPVSVGGYSLSGADAGNYNLAQPSGLSASISAAGLSVSGITADNKVYDGTTTAVLHTAGAVLVGVLGSDSVSLNVAGATGAFGDADVGVGKPVSISGLSVSGADALNYGLVAPTASANITMAGLTVAGLGADNKVYDGTTVASLETNNVVLVGVQGTDQVSLILSNAVGSFDSKAVGNGKTVTVSGLELAGPDAGKYALTAPTTNADITAAALSLSGLSAESKVYDGTVAATLSGTPSLVGVLGGDAVSLSGTAAASFGDKTVGVGKPVSVGGYSLSGADAGNYNLAQPSGLSASISAAGLSLGGLSANNKVYDGTVAASLSGTASLVGVLGSDVVSLSGTAGALFGDKAVGVGKPVSVTGLSLSGADGGNYTVAALSLTADISPAGLTVTGVGVNHKVYDATTVATLNGTASLLGVQGGDAVSLSGTGGASFGDKTVGVGKPVSVGGYSLSGADAGNYNLAQPSGLSASISAAGLSVSGITADNKVYDGTTTAVLHTAGAVLVGVLGSDSVSLNVAGATGTFGDADVGVGKPVSISGLSVSGADALNYGLVAPTTSANITMAGLTVAGLGADNKVYDGTTVASLETNNVALVGVQGTDQVSLILSNAVGSFDSKAVGSGKTVTVSGLELAGPDAGKYALTAPTTNADITAAALSLSGLSAESKVYDGTVAATLSGSPSLVGVLGSDEVSLNIESETAAFADASVGTGKPVTVSGLSLTGADAANYTLDSTASASADITPATLIGTAADQTRLYGQPNAAFNVTYAGFVGTEDASVLTGTLVITTVATQTSPAGNYAITPSGQSAANYNIQYVAGTLTIAPLPLSVKAMNATRAYGQPNPAFAATFLGFVNGDDSNSLGGTLQLSTTAQLDSPTGDYPIVPGGLLSANYAITFLDGTLTITTTNQPPVLAVIDDAVVRPDELLMIQLDASDPNGNQFTFSLDPGAPAGAVVTNMTVNLPKPATNTVFFWRPTRAQASTTNLITVRVTDNGGPPLSATQTFTVAVLDYLEIAIGSTNVQSGDSVAVPIVLSSSDGVTNLDFNIRWRADYLLNPALTIVSPTVGASSLQDQGTNLLLSIQAAPGQVLQGTQLVAQLSFEAVSNQYSAFVPLTVETPTASKPDGSSYTNYVTPGAIVAVIEGDPMLLSFLSGDSVRYLTLFGRLGLSYQLQSSASVAGPVTWTPVWNYVQTNNAITIPADPTQPLIFYRIFKP